MNKLRTLKEIYDKEGLQSVLKECREYLFINGPAAPYIKSILGRRIHHKLYMYLRLGYWPNIKNPRSFNEKLLHRKLYTNNELFSVVEDKWRVREYVSKKVGDDILTEVYHITDDPSTIPFKQLPEEYVIKPTHLSGGANFIIDKESCPPNFEIIEKTCSQWLNKTYGQMKEEYWYLNITPRIMVEEYIDSNKYKAPIDYKFMVFHGEVKFIHATYNRFDDKETERVFYDNNWNEIDVALYFKQGKGIPKPPKFNKMIKIAEKLGEDFEHVRIDLYNPNETDVYFGEITVAESSGGNPFVPREYDFKFGSYW